MPGRRLSKKVCSTLGPLCEGAPPAGGGGENCAVAQNISGYGKVLSLRPFGAPLPLWRKRHLPPYRGRQSHRGVSTIPGPMNEKLVPWMQSSPVPSPPNLRHWING